MIPLSPCIRMTPATSSGIEFAVSNPNKLPLAFAVVFAPVRSTFAPLFVVVTVLPVKALPVIVIAVALMVSIEAGVADVKPVIVRSAVPAAKSAATVLVPLVRRKAVPPDVIVASAAPV